MIVPNRNELVRIFEEISPSEPFGARDRAMIVLLANTALRVSELAGLDVHHLVEFGEVRDHVDVPREWAKGSHSRRVPLNTGARKAVAAILCFNDARGFSTAPDAPLLQDRWHRRLPVRSIQRMLQKYRERAQVSDGVTPHALRHYGADRALHRGANVRHLQTWLGHKRLETVQVYTRTHPEDLRQTVGL